MIRQRLQECFHLSQGFIHSYLRWPGCHLLSCTHSMTVIVPLSILVYSYMIISLFCVFVCVSGLKGAGMLGLVFSQEI